MMISMKKLPKNFISNVFLGIISLILAFGAGTVGAQGLYDNSISAVVLPENPKPKSSISIRLDSSLVDLPSSTISWYVNNKKISEGKDLRTFNFSLPESGTTKVEARINSSDYGLIVKNFSFAPNLVEIIFEANSYTPPFYKGRALVPPEGVVTLLAMPDFKTSSGNISSKNLVFTWTNDGTVQGDKSGLGKNTYTFNNGRLSEDAPFIEVSVTSPQNNLTGYANFRIGSVEPEIVFYEDNPLLGVTLNKAIQNTFFLNKQEVTIIAYPYYFGGKNKDSVNLQYSWLINSLPVSPTGSAKTNLTVRKPDGTGSSSISLGIDNLRRIFQTAKTGIIVQYGN